MKKVVSFCLGIVLLSALQLAAREPVIWWTSEEVSEIKKHIEGHPLGQKQLEKTLQGPAAAPNLSNLFRFAVQGDEQAGEREKRGLLKFIGRKPEPLTWNKDPKDLVWNEGMPSGGDSHMRDDQSINVWRYDVLYDLLTPEERAGVEESFRSYIQFHLDGGFPRHPKFSYSRSGWLPNMHWPRAQGTHLMALVMRDEALIKAMFESEGGFKWYMDEYIADGFYMEEFNKYSSTLYAMLLWCEGLDALGLGQYGYDYKSPSGNTMREYARMYLRIAYPKTQIPGGMDRIRRITMGDAKGTGFGISGVFEHPVVTGYLANGQGGDRYWMSHRMTGGYAKGQEPMWFEVAVQRWPEDGYGYILHQMREPGQEQYVPTLFHGLKPLEEAEREAPSVASYLSEERGFAFLRMEESPDYWDSSAPAVVQQFGMYYVHYVHDAFSLLGYHAFNRPIYLNSWGGSGKGYAGGHPWKDSTRGHMGIVIDNEKPRPIDRGERGLENHSNIRFESTPEYKVSGARAKGLWQGVDLERVLVLTNDYLVDVTHVKADKERQIDWMAHGPGMLADGTGWSPSDDLSGKRLYLPLGSEASTDTRDDLRNLQKREEDENWQTTFVQSLHPSFSMENSVLGEEWYDRGVGVRVAMAETKGTKVYTGEPPVRFRKGAHKISEAGGFTLMARRNASETTFAALHVPFEGGVEKAPEVSIESHTVSDGVLLLKVKVRDREDLIALALGDTFKEKKTIDLKGVKLGDASLPAKLEFAGQILLQGQ